MADRYQGWTDLADSSDRSHRMFDYLEPEDVDPRFGGGSREERGRPHFRFALVGAGVAGQGNMVGLLSEGRAAVHGIFDTRRRSVDTALANLQDPDQVKVYDSADEACNDPDVDAIVIASPNHTHREIFEKAVDGHKHILLQKPMATTVQDAWAMVESGREYDRVAMLFLEYRLKPLYLHAAHEAFVRQSLGNVKMITIWEYRPPFLNKAGQWNKFSKYSGGTLVEKCCHYFDQFNFFANSRPLRVFASGSAEVHYKDFEYKGERSDILDNAYVIVDYENGVRACMDFCMFAHDSSEGININGDRGRFRGEDGPPADMRIRSDNTVPDAEIVSRWRRGGAHSGSSPIQIKLFADAGDGWDVPYPTIVDGFWATVVGVAAEKSGVAGAPIDIPALLEASGCPAQGP